MFLKKDFFKTYYFHILYFSYCISTLLQVAKFWFTNDSYINGLRIDYLAFSLYLSDILVLVFVFVTLFLQKGESWKNLKATVNKYGLHLVFLLLFIGVNTYVSSLHLLTFVKWIKLMAITLGVFLVTHLLNKEKKSYMVLMNSVFIFLSFFLAFTEIVNDGSIGGIFYYLGERPFSITGVGIALGSLGGRELVRPYSLFPHPNVLGGVMVTIFFLTAGLVKELKIKNKISKWKNSFQKSLAIFAITLVMGIILIFLKYISDSAFVAYVFGLFVYLLNSLVKNKKILATILSLFIISANMATIMGSYYAKNISAEFATKKEVSERLYLNRRAIKAISEKPFLGGGLLSSVTDKEGLTDGEVLRNFYQPTHNIFLVLAEEMGIVMAVIVYGYLLVLLMKTLKKNVYYSLALLSILLIGLADHYFVTLQQGTYILVLAIFLALRDNTNYER